MTCDVCKQPIGDGLVVRWVSGVKHHMRCPEQPRVDKTASRLANLARANEVRLARAALKREIRDGQLLVVDALDDPRAGSMNVFGLLCCQARWGEQRAMRLLDGLGLNPYMPVGVMSLPEKAAVMDVLEPVEAAA